MGARWLQQPDSNLVSGCLEASVWDVDPADQRPWAIWPTRPCDGLGPRHCCPTGPWWLDWSQAIVRPVAIQCRLAGVEVFGTQQRARSSLAPCGGVGWDWPGTPTPWWLRCTPFRRLVDLEPFPCLDKGDLSWGPYAQVRTRGGVGRHQWRAVVAWWQRWVSQARPLEIRFVGECLGSNCGIWAVGSLGSCCVLGHSGPGDLHPWRVQRHAVR